MKDWQSFFKGKKITVMGLGLLGRGVGDVKFLAEMGAELIVTDLKRAEDLKESLDALTVAGLTPGAVDHFVLGEHRLQDFRGRDFILKAAGVPLDSPYIAEARKNGIPIEMSTALFAYFAKKAGVTIVGVTGTRGKSTVTDLIHQVLQTASEHEAGITKKGKRRTIFLGGNVRGVATLPFLRDVKKGDIAVLELDSWQLQGFAERGISPQIAVFTTFLSDHQNYYKGDHEAYLNDKAAILQYQTLADYLVLGSQAASIIQNKYGKIMQSKVLIADENNIPAGWKVQIPGEHNKYNIGLAIEAVKACGQKTGISIDEMTLKKAVEAFKGVPGRLEFLGEFKGIKIYNDNNATTPDATVAGIRALDVGRRDIVLIFGGTDKALDVGKLCRADRSLLQSGDLFPGDRHG